MGSEPFVGPSSAHPTTLFPATSTESPALFGSKFVENRRKATMLFLNCWFMATLAGLPQYPPPGVFQKTKDTPLKKAIHDATRQR